MDDRKCFVGWSNNTKCIGDTTKNDRIWNFDELSSEERLLLELRVPNINVKNICTYHKSYYLDKYSLKQCICLDPFNKHKSSIKSNLREITLDMYYKFKQATGKVITPGNKLCLNCLKEINLITNLHTQDPNSEDLQPSSLSSSENLDKSECQTSSEFFTSSQEEENQIKNLKRILDTVDVPMPSKKRLKLSEIRYEKQVENVAYNVCDKVINEFNNALDLNLVSNVVHMKKQSDFLNEIMRDLKIKFDKEQKVQEKIRLLTLLPSNLTFKETFEIFNCSKRMFRKAKTIKQEKGILETVSKRKANIYTEEKINKIQQFYRDNSRICAGTKECLSVYDPITKVKEKRQKMLILTDLKNLHFEYVKQCQNNEEESVPSFSYFASLRPKECVLAGEPGTHTVCVCIQHQNAKLKLKAVSNSIPYREVLEQSVCSLDIQKCMFHECEQCSGEAGIRKYFEINKYLQNEKIINYNIWESVTTTDNKKDVQSLKKVKLIEKSEPLSEFFDQLVRDLFDLTIHHYIAEDQKNIYIEMKNSLDSDTGLMLMDFSENYAFIAQDSTQGFYFNNDQATVHPFVLYYTEHNSLKTESFCVISDYNKHNAYVVHIFLENVLSKIKEKLPNLKKMVYFSDGAPAQYKNK